MTTRCPRQIRRKWSEDVIEGHSNDNVIVDGNHGIQHDITYANTYNKNQIQIVRIHSTLSFEYITVPILITEYPRIASYWNVLARICYKSYWAMWVCVTWLWGYLYYRWFCILTRPNMQPPYPAIVQLLIWYNLCLLFTLKNFLSWCLPWMKCYG